ncbi:unnamed protein product [Jaminaea pallidilutea]
MVIAKLLPAVRPREVCLVVNDGIPPRIPTSKTSNSTTAQIIATDKLFSGGVLHLIDQVLFNPNLDPAAADAAYTQYQTAAAALNVSGSGIETATIPGAAPGPLPPVRRPPGRMSPSSAMNQATANNSPCSERVRIPELERELGDELLFNQSLRGY